MSGNLVYDSSGLFDHGSISKVKTTLPKLSFKVIVSPLLERLIIPVVATTTCAVPKFQVGLPPPKITNALSGPKMLPAGKICLGVAVLKARPSYNS